MAYQDSGEYKIVRPDFIFFAKQEDGTVVADLVDPHGIHLSDALPKLRGLAVYAETHTDVFRRIESVAEVKGKLRVLDLKREDVRKAIAETEEATATALFDGELAGFYK